MTNPGEDSRRPRRELRPLIADSVVVGLGGRQRPEGLTNPAAVSHVSAVARAIPALSVERRELEPVHPDQDEHCGERAHRGVAVGRGVYHRARPGPVPGPQHPQPRRPAPDRRILRCLPRWPGSADRFSRSEFRVGASYENYHEQAERHNP